ncbi:hypothetical protein BpHYR1_033118 [Brachionus plicatilis]|uniref:Uncharacterized protein n=1 Tax=Brachionus plicatilis TaxID=10195 RepID=A0A3M7PP99_BRAPC|nr:hypothetical protein BpHYR1_033118 [Brachionus plicatilis]
METNQTLLVTIAINLNVVLVYVSRFPNQFSCWAHSQRNWMHGSRNKKRLLWVIKALLGYFCESQFNLLLLLLKNGEKINSINANSGDVKL